MSRAASRRIEVSPAALGSLALHIAVAAAFMISWGSRELKVGAVVPVTIVSSAPSEASRADQGPETLEAATEEPAPDAPPEPVPPPPQPTPTPSPTPKAAKPAEKSLDLDALAASLTRPARNTPQQPSSAPKGPTRTATAPVARQTNGFAATSGTAVSSGMQEELERNWSIDCSLASTRDVLVRTHFTIGTGGRLIGDVRVESQGSNSASVIAAAEYRARQAVLRSQPFVKEPRQNWGQRFYADFSARDYCGKSGATG